MSTTARKARKRAGEKFTRTPKIGTPLLDRAWFAGLVWGPKGTKNESLLGPRSAKKIKAALAARGFEIVNGDLVRKEDW